MCGLDGCALKKKVVLAFFWRVDQKPKKKRLQAREEIQFFFLERAKSKIKTK
jgi:hypothetical protein